MLYIDVETGVWGGADNLRLVEDTAEVFEYLSEASDSEIIDCGIDSGTPLDLEDL